MKIYKILLTLISFSIIFSACSLISKKYQKSAVCEYTINASGKNTLLIDGIDGYFIFKQSNDSFIKVNYKTTLHLKKSELGNEIVPIKIKVDTLDNKLTLKVIEKISEISFFKIGKSVKEEYEIYVPDNLTIELNSHFSNLDLYELKNNFKINLINGNITVKKPFGSYNINIINGKLKVDADSIKYLQANITNGKFYLFNTTRFSGNFNLNVENGKIINRRINFDNIIKSDKKSLIVSKGNSEKKIDVNIVNGKIYLKDNVKVEE